MSHKDINLIINVCFNSDLFIQPILDHQPEFNRPDTPRAECYYNKDHHFWSAKKIFEKRRPRIQSDTTGAETHDHENENLNMFQSLKRLINEQIDNKQQVYPEIPESPEIRHSNSGESVSSEEKKNDFESKKLDFLFKLYDQRRAAGIKPAMEYEYNPNFDILECNSDHPCEEIVCENPPYLVLINGENIDENIDSSSDEKIRLDTPNSMNVEVNSCCSNPDKEDIKAFLEDSSLKEKQEDFIPKHGENFNTKFKMNEMIHNGYLTPTNTSHNKETIEYEDQDAKEAYKEIDESPIKERRNKLKYRVIPEKRLTHKNVCNGVKRIEIFMPDSSKSVQKPFKRYGSCKVVSRNHIDHMQRIHPEYFETIEPWKDLGEFT